MLASVIEEIKLFLEREREVWKFFLTSIDRMRVVYGQTVIFYNRRI